MTEFTFRASGDVAAMAEAYALDAIDLARENFGVSLTFDEAGVAALEGILAGLHASIASAPSPEHVFQFAKMFGSFLGEVLRKLAGGTWGWTGDGADAFPSLRLADESLVWPWARAHKRLTEGSEEDVLVYYRRLVAG